MILFPAVLLASLVVATPQIWPCEDARQGVAVDATALYAINTRSIAKLDRATGVPLARWEAGDDHNFIHLDSGVIVDGKLYCAHSNYPNLPMTSSVEIWDTATLTHTGTHSFGIAHGSCTWVDRHADAWWAAFAHYDKHPGGEPGKDNTWTVLVQYDDTWRECGCWTFPQEMLEKLHPYSVSGGTWGSDGKLYCTGHDPAEVYVLTLPEAGGILRLEKNIPFPIRGQGIAFDRTAPEPILFGIQRDQHAIVAQPLE